MVSRILRVVSACITSLGLAASTDAATISYNLSYSGASFGNSATGTGVISFDDAVLPNGPVTLNNVSPATLGIVDFTITISSANSGNGIFGLADFSLAPDGWVWDLSASVDLGTELVGQAGFSDFNWCAITQSCGNSAAPGGVSTLTISTDGETGDVLVLTSMAPAAVPIPAALWLFGSGLLGLLGMARRKKTA